jgi:hypothetical protein
MVYPRLGRHSRRVPGQEAAVVLISTATSSGDDLHCSGTSKPSTVISTAERARALRSGEVSLLVLNAFLEDQNRRGIALRDHHLMGQIPEARYVACVQPMKL